MNSTNSVDRTSLGAIRATLFLAGAGAFGGIAGFGLGEILHGESGPRFFGNNLNANTALWFALVLLGVGAALVASQGLSEGNVQKAAETVLRSLPVILIGGAFAGYVAQVVYAGLLGEAGEGQVAARAIGWMIAGGLGGVAVGLGFRSMKRTQNGAIGGAAGGLVGGLLFDVIANSIDSGAGARFVGLLLIGVLMGALIGLVDTLRTDVWLTVTSGEMTGKQFIIFDESTIVGCVRNVPITIVADRAVAEHHIRIDRKDGTTTFECLYRAAPITVNGSELTSGPLSDGDAITIGNTELRVSERTASSPAGVTPSTSTGSRGETSSRPNLSAETPGTERPSRASSPPQHQGNRTAPAPSTRQTIQVKPDQDN